jgi:hypothetical protein
MAVTPNYNWPLPDDTSLVKDGAEAIRDLGNAIDTTVEDLPSGGLVHINSTSFSAVASQSINDVFSATFDNYMMQLFFKNDTAQSYTALRYRVAGADDTNSAYDSRTTFMAGSIGVTDQPNLSTQRISFGSAFGNYHTIFIGRPFIADKTYIKVQSTNNNAAGDIYAEDYFGVFQNATSFTGFTIIPAANNITGVVRVYGIQN